jgi:hypothetical protein
MIVLNDSCLRRVLKSFFVHCKHLRSPSVVSKDTTEPCEVHSYLSRPCAVCRPRDAYMQETRTAITLATGLLVKPSIDSRRSAIMEHHAWGNRRFSPRLLGSDPIHGAHIWFRMSSGQLPCTREAIVLAATTNADKGYSSRAAPFIQSGLTVFSD